MISFRLILWMALLQGTAVSCRAQIAGCTDPLANNYDPSATVNDGSCTYDPFSVSPKQTIELSDMISGTSGLILWDGNLWTHNDYLDRKIYGLDTVTATIQREYQLEGVENTDWEEVSQDEDYLYIGDFGNNLSGNRTDLHILRIHKQELIQGIEKIDTIWFSYSDQTDFSPAVGNATDFDCEAFIVTGDSIYLFTKQWISAMTTVYALPKVPGTHTAFKKNTFNVQGLITGATYLGSSRLLVLCGYTSLLQPFLYLLYDFKGSSFFSGNKRWVTVSLPFHQIEGIATSNGCKYYVTNEQFVLQPVADNPQKLHRFDLNSLLGAYLGQPSATGNKPEISGNIRIYPVPSEDIIAIESDPVLLPGTFEIIDLAGKPVLKGNLCGRTTHIEIGSLAAGVYLVRTCDAGPSVSTFIKL